MKVLISCVNDNYRNQQIYQEKTGYKVGKFDCVIKYSINDIDAEFLYKNKEILSIERGIGLWLWKPYFILKTLKKLADGDYLFYCDAAAYFLKPIDTLIDIMNRDNIDIMCFEIPLLERAWTSKTCLERLGCTEKKYADTPQRVGNYMLFKNSEYSRKIVDEYLNLCEDIDTIVGGELGEDCIAHRNDQSVWSLVTKKHNIKAYRDPSQFGFFPESYINYAINKRGIALTAFTDHSSSNYPCIIYLYRKGKEYQVKYRIKSYLRLKRNLYFISKF